MGSVPGLKFSPRSKTVTPMRYSLSRTERLRSFWSTANCRNRYSLLLEAGISVAIPVFVVVERDFLGQLEQRHLRAGKDARAQRRVQLDLFELVRSKPLRFAQDGVWHADLSDIVQRRRQADHLHLRFG